MAQPHLLDRLFPADDVRHILVPRGRLAGLLLTVLLAEIAVSLLWQGILTVVAVFLAIPTLLLLYAAGRIWRRYYATVWYILLAALMTVAAVGLRVALSARL